jgi:hypothetical protein
MNTAGRPNSARLGRVNLRHPVNAPPAIFDMEDLHARAHRQRR